MWITIPEIKHEILRPMPMKKKEQKIGVAIKLGNVASLYFNDPS